MTKLRISGILAPSERERIMRALAELCAERGYRGLSVAAIAARAAVSEAQFYAQFEGVEECMGAALNALTAQVLVEVSGAYSPDRSEWESGMLGMRAILELMAHNPPFAHLGYVAARQMGSRRHQEIYMTGRQWLIVMIERLWEYSELEVEPRAAASAALGSCEALIRRELVAGRIGQLPRLLPDLVYSATIAFLGQEEALRLAASARRLAPGA